jgi:hypothetical protein
MNKPVLFFFAAALLLASCSKKTHPAVSKPIKKPDTAVQEKNTRKEPEPTVPEVPPAGTPVTEIPAAAAVFTSPMIIIDEAGKIITPRDSLPVDIAQKVDYKKITRAFTPEQRKNLIYRFKMVPPRVLFVPDNLTSKSARGTYVVYKKKFWYWKKEDRLFHLDETYYQ